MSVDRKEVIMVDVDLIAPDPNQPRKEFVQKDIEDTATTMLKQGVINPIEIDDNYMIVTGEIRWRAAKHANIKQVPCVIWSNGESKRFERQVVENLHHHKLNDKDRDAAIIKLWNTKGDDTLPLYPSHERLARAVGLSRESISHILSANEFKQRTQMVVTTISTANITDTMGLDDYTRVKILEKVADGNIRPTDISEVVKLAKTSDALLEKVLDRRVPLQRALETADAINEIAKRGVALTQDQMQNLADKVAEDETLLDKYKDAVLERVKGAVTKSKTPPRIEEPISPTSPVQNIIRVKDEVMDRFRVYIGRCTMNERRWAKRTMIEIRDELNELIEMIKED